MFVIPYFVAMRTAYLINGWILLQDNMNVSTLILDDNKLGWKGAGYIALMLCENAVINSLVRAVCTARVLYIRTVITFI